MLRPISARGGCQRVIGDREPPRGGADGGHDEVARHSAQQCLRGAVWCYHHTGTLSMVGEIVQGNNSSSSVAKLSQKSDS